MMDKIAEAIAYADRAEHNGAGYTLRIHTSAGNKVEVSVFREGNGHRFERRNQFGHDYLEGTPVFFNPAHVAWVEVLW